MPDDRNDNNFQTPREPKIPGMPGGKKPTRTGWLYFILACALLGYAFFNMGSGFANSSNTVKLATSEMVSAIKQDRVEDLTYTVQDGSVTGHYWKTKKDKGDTSELKSFSSTYVGSDSLAELMAEHPDTKYIVNTNDPDFWGDLAMSVLPTIALIAIMFYFMRQMMGANNRNMQFGKTNAKTNEATRPKVKFEDVAGVDEAVEELEEILIMGDLGINATTSIIEDLKRKVKEQHIKNPSECKELLIESIKDEMNVGETAYEFENRTSVVLVIGVNGVGKTTSVGKLAGKLKDQGKKVIVAAADTYRAAAGEQLTEWAHRAGVDLIGGQAGADPAAIVYDAVAAAKARNADVLLCDTAGRLHNKKNLMEELRKIYRVLEREYPDAYLETLVVLDGTTGQNALAQARQFKEVANVTGIILTKLDGTAKGGIAVAIQSELDIPVKYIGVGESIDDLQKFNAEQFVNALFDVKTEEEES